MGYEAALSKAWSEVQTLSKEKVYHVHFLNDTYTINVNDKNILSDACNIPAKHNFSILLLHYIARALRGLPDIKGEWITFQELSGGQGYYPAFKKRALVPLVEKYGDTPETLFDTLERFRSRREHTYDASVILNVFEGVPILIKIWSGDEEFGPEAKMLFDKSIVDIFSTEDVVVLAEIIARNI